MSAPAITAFRHHLIERAEGVTQAKTRRPEPVHSDAQVGKP
jgi:hypothetical protein